MSVINKKISDMTSVSSLNTTDLFTIMDPTVVDTSDRNRSILVSDLNNYYATRDYVASVVNGLDWQDSVIDKDLTSPPGSPTTGDRYIVGASATGDWSGYDDYVTEYDGADWQFYGPNEGFAVWVEDEDKQYVYNGSAWVLFGTSVLHNNLAGLQGGTTSEYYHLTATDYGNLTDVNAQLSALHTDGTPSFNGLIFNQVVSAPSFAEGQVYWDPTDNTLSVQTDITDVTLQVGQEFHVRVYNDTGSQLDNGSAVYFSGASNGRPEVSYAQANTPSVAEFFSGLMTADLADSAEGALTLFGLVRGLDTSSLTAGSPVYISPTTPGGLTSTRPQYPNYRLMLGGCITSDASNGSIFVFPQEGIESIYDNGWNGNFLEPFTFVVTSNGSTITGSLEQSGGGDLIMNFSTGQTVLDCTPAATVTLTAGSSTDPTYNWVYIPISTKVLTVATGTTEQWPSEEHIKIATALVLDATTTQTIGGGLIDQNRNDHIAGTNKIGHIHHIAHRIRLIGAQYESGVSPTISVTTNVGTPDNVNLALTSGVVYQLHDQTFPAFDTSSGDEFFVINDSSTPYAQYSDLADLLTDASGGSLASSYFSFVIAGVANKSGQPCPVFVNLPTGSYSNVSDAINDVDGYDVYNFPSVYRNVIFYIARVTLRHQAASGGTWTVVQTEDLRGKDPTTVGGGSVIASVVNYSDNTFTIFNATDSSKIAAFDASSISSSTTRTFTFPDVNGTFITTGNSTSDLPEGSNLYYTDERVDDRVAALIQDGTGIAWTYADVSNTLTANIGGLTVSEFASANISQWTNDSGYLTPSTGVTSITGTSNQITASASVGDVTLSLNSVTIISDSINGAMYHRIDNTSSGSDAYAMQYLTNDSASGLAIFLNSSARTDDGGVNTATLRNDAGALRLQNSGGYGAFITGTGTDFTGDLSVSTLTASRLMASDGSKNLASVSTLSSWVAGTTNQISVSDDGDGSITLALPQNIHTSAGPTFANLILNSSFAYLNMTSGVDTACVVYTANDAQQWMCGTNNDDKFIIYDITHTVTKIEIVPNGDISMDNNAITSTQWGYLAGLDQSLATSDSPMFSGGTYNGTVTINQDSNALSLNSGASSSPYITYGRNGSILGYVGWINGSTSNVMYVSNQKNSYIVFQTNGFNDYMVLDPSGNLGIGTTPGEKLHTYLSGTGVSNVLRMDAGLDGSNSTSNSCLVDMYHKGGGGGTVRSYVKAYYNGVNYGIDIDPYVGGGGKLNVIGYLSLNTTSEAGSLTIEQTANNKGLYITDTGYGSGHIYIDSTLGDLNVKEVSGGNIAFINSAGTNIAYFHYNGTLGLGVTNSTYRLQAVETSTSKPTIVAQKGSSVTHPTYVASSALSLIRNANTTDDVYLNLVGGSAANAGITFGNSSSLELGSVYHNDSTDRICIKRHSSYNTLEFDNGCVTHFRNTGNIEYGTISGEFDATYGYGFEISGTGGNIFFTGGGYSDVGTVEAHCDNFNVYSDTYSVYKFRVGTGVIVGVPSSGGDKGAGTINCEADIYKNNSAYTNPDYALEHYYTGEIKLFAQNDGASEYKGLLPIDELDEYLKTHYRLPGMNDDPMGAFKRSDFVLEKVEEGIIYITQLHSRIKFLESEITALNKKLAA